MGLIQNVVQQISEHGLHRSAHSCASTRFRPFRKWLSRGPVIADHPARRRPAAARTPSSPRDLETRRSVRSSNHGSTFSLVSPLPSTDSAGSGPLSLFAGFCGTVERSDSPETCRSDLWPRAFSDRSASMEEAMSPGSLGFREEPVQPCLWS